MCETFFQGLKPILLVQFFFSQGNKQSLEAGKEFSEGVKIILRGKTHLEGVKDGVV